MPRRKEPTEQQRIREAWDDEIRRRYESYGLNDEQQFLTVASILVNHLEGWENVGAPWPDTNCPVGVIPRLPGQTMANALENYRLVGMFVRDAEDLLGRLPAPEQLHRFAIALNTISWELPGSFLEWNVEDFVAKDQDEEAGIEIIREAMRRAHSKGGETLKGLLMEYGSPESKIAPSPAKVTWESALDGTDWQVLRYLAESESPMIQSEIAEGVSKGDGTIQKSVQTLERLGYANRPRGDRKGYRITPAGIDRITRIK